MNPCKNLCFGNHKNTGEDGFIFFQKYLTKNSCYLLSIMLRYEKCNIKFCTIYWKATGK